MRQQVANTVLASFALAGCSLVYNPSNLPDPKKDAGAIDAEEMVDADPSMISLDHVFPTVIYEGTGDGTSRKVVITISGTNFIPEATVEIKAHGAGPTPKIMVDNTQMDRVAENGKMIAVPVILQVDPALAANAEIRLDVSVTQPTSMGPKTVDLTEVAGGPTLTLKGLPELTSATMVDVAGGDYMYSRVSVMGDLVATGTLPLRIVSTSTINVTGIVKANATGSTGGAGGANGGQGGDASIPPTNGMPGTDGGPSGGGKASGGGAGHAADGGGGAIAGKAYGNDSMHTLFGGSGGAGGNGGATTSGGDGGGGGGIIELTANGNLSIGGAEAKGANGAVGSSDDGGGGSGGSVLLRSLGTLAVASISVDGGATGLNPGSAGRARYDAASGPDMVGMAYRGPMFHPSMPLITRSEKPAIMVTGKKMEQFQYYYESDEGMGIQGPFDASISSTGTNQIALPQPLYRGSNTFCLLVKGAELATPNREAKNCTQLVYLHRFAQ